MVWERLIRPETAPSHTGSSLPTKCLSTSITLRLCIVNSLSTRKGLVTAREVSPTHTMSCARPGCHGGNFPIHIYHTMHDTLCQPLCMLIHQPLFVLTLRHFSFENDAGFVLYDGSSISYLLREDNNLYLSR